MNRVYYSILFLTLSPIILMFIHILIVQVLNKLKLSISLQLSLIITELLLNIPVLYIIYFINKSISSIIYGFIVYNCLGYAYFHFFNMSETARRIRILTEIYKEKSVNIQDLEKHYESEFMINIRLERLIGLKQIRKENNKYFLSGKILLLFSKLMYSGRKILGLE